jgi:uncharacterized membrane protein YjfL (UPF0719 family)
MSEDESFCLFVSIAIAVWGTGAWYSTLIGAAGQTGSRWIRPALGLILPATLGVLWTVLEVLAAIEVREDFTYVFLFLVVGTAWFSITTRLLLWLGVNVRDDALERSNAAVAVAACGIIGGTMTVFTAANIGEGPTIWTTIGPAAIGSIALLLLWLLVAVPTELHEALGVERDVATGVRAAGLMLACGLVLGRAVSGNWEGMDPMMADFFRLGAPAPLIAVVAAALQYTLRPTPANPQPAVVIAGVVPALLMLAAAVLWVWQQGAWR